MTPPTQISVLYVEDDERLRKLTTQYLQMHGVHVYQADSGQHAVHITKTKAPDIILLDLCLPDSNGHDICHSLRSITHAPILIISALDEEADRVLGLETGADDYITKPFSSRELLARIRAHLRRAQRPTPPHPTIRLGPLSIQTSNRVVTLGGDLLDLTSYEFDLLYTLASNHGRVLNREQIIQHTRQHEDDVFERAVDVQISRLRQKLGDDPRNPSWIKTIRGVGYMMTNGDP